MGLPLANVQTTDTFQTWLTRTNQIITVAPNTAYVAANTFVNQQVATLNATRAANTYVNALLANTNAFINTKLNISGGTISGNLTVQTNLTVDGNFTVNGNTSVINVTNFRVVDSIIQLASNNLISDTLDVGFVAHYNDGTWANQHTGLIRDSGTKQYYLFSKYQPELASNNNVNISHPSFRLADLNVADFTANTFSGNGALITSLNATQITSGTLNANRLATSGVVANTYGSASKVPVITVDDKGRVTVLTETNVAGVTNFTYTNANTTLTISTADGGSFKAKIADNTINAKVSNTVTLIATNSTDATHYVTFVDSATGDENVRTDTGLIYNPSSGILEAVDFNSTSDERLKKNIKPIENALDKVMSLAGVQFDWKETDRHSIGLIAQQVEQIVPEVVETKEDGYKSISYGKLTGLLIEAIKELKAIVDSK